MVPENAIFLCRERRRVKRDKGPTVTGSFEFSTISYVIIGSLKAYTLHTIIPTPFLMKFALLLVPAAAVIAQQKAKHGV
jgi:hypothetical protein